jgi:hypothetical protein
MIVSSNTNLIPYPDHQYEIKSFVQTNLILIQNRGQEAVRQHDLFKRTNSNITTSQLNCHANTYDVKRSMAFVKDDQVGLLVDIYA